MGRVGTEACLEDVVELVDELGLLDSVGRGGNLVLQDGNGDIARVDGIQLRSQHSSHMRLK